MECTVNHPTDASPDQSCIEVADKEEKPSNNHTGFYPSVVDRYFTPYFASPPVVGRASDISSTSDVCELKILFHSNKLCVITLSPIHPILSSKSQITDVNYQVTDKCNRFMNTVSGKRKRGAQWLNPESPICRVTTSDGVVHVIRSGIRGNLIEVNERLRHSPHLLTKFPQTEGYIAIVMVKIDEAKQIIEGLMDKVRHEKQSVIANKT